MSQASIDVLAERQRQIDVERWHSEHDDEHESGVLAVAGACYAAHAAGDEYLKMYEGVPLIWPWDKDWWKPKGMRRDLVRAAALIIAEIERMDRVTPPPPPRERP